MIDVVSLIDHAVLQPTHADQDVRAACALCDRLGVASICVKPSHVPLAASLLADSPVRVSTVIGFPHGGTSTAAKVAETAAACQAGGVEVDMVVNLGSVYSGEWAVVEEDIRKVVAAANDHGALVKVIFETGLLADDATKIRLCQISHSAGAAYVKTSTGFGYVKGPDGQLTATGATDHDIRLMREHSPPTMGVKASGGIRSYADAVRLVELGATRLGTSSTEAIASGANSSESY